MRAAATSLATYAIVLTAGMVVAIRVYLSAIDVFSAICPLRTADRVSDVRLSPEYMLEIILLLLEVTVRLRQIFVS